MKKKRGGGGMGVGVGVHSRDIVGYHLEIIYI